jgi:hypothetical protein
MSALKVLVAKDVAYASKIGGGTVGNAFVDGNALVDGGIAFYTEDGRVLTAAGATATLAAQPNTKKIFASVGFGDLTKNPIQSGAMDRETADVQFLAYRAAVRHVVQVGQNAAIGALNLPTLVERQEAILRVIINKKGTLTPTRRSYSEMVRVGDTGAAIITRLVAKIVADADSRVTSAVLNSGTGFSLTSLYDNERIQVALDGILANATVYANGEATSSSVQIVNGNGTYAQIAELAKLAESSEGHENRSWLQDAYWTGRSTLTPGTNYDVWTITWVNNRLRSSPGVPHNAPFTTIIAVPQGSATVPIATITTILAAAFGTVDSEETGA